MVIPIACKFPAAVFTDSFIVGPAIYFFRVSIPPCHATGIGTKTPLSMVRCLFQRPPAVPAKSLPLCDLFFPHGMSGAKGLHSIQRQSRQCGYFFVPIALILEFNDPAAFGFCHNHPFFLKKHFSPYPEKSAFCQGDWIKNNAHRRKICFLDERRLSLVCKLLSLFRTVNLRLTIKEPVFSTLAVFLSAWYSGWLPSRFARHSQSPFWFLPVQTVF